MHHMILKLFFIVINLIAVFLSTSVVETAASNHVTITTELNTIKGTVRLSREHREYFEFLGLKYATVLKRFQAAQPVVNKLEEFIDATQFGPSCIQYDGSNRKVTGEEDCLFLNVYTPIIPERINSKLKMPVMVFVHGGGFFSGSSQDYGPIYFMDENVILVTFNYRLGPFGFLSGNIKEAQGNVGLKDQVLALKWVQRSIPFFGGDPSRVTIFGQSAGAASVSLLMLSSLTQGLFTQAISQSGTAVCPWAIIENGNEQTKNLARVVGCPTFDSKIMVECLVETDAKEILIKFQSISTFTSENKIVTSFGPIVEQTTETGEHFLTESPHLLLANGQFHKIPWIIGANNQEGLMVEADPLLRDPFLIRSINEDWNHVAPVAFLFDRNNSVASQRIRQFYFGDERISNATRVGLANLYSDRWFFHCSRLAALQHSKYSSAYLYIFNKETKSEAFGLPENSVPTHGDEMQYLFDIRSSFPTISRYSQLYNFSKAFVQLWTSFSETGLPSKTWSIENTWRAVNPQTHSPKWLQINTETRLVSEGNNFENRMEFWNNLGL